MRRGSCTASTPPGRRSGSSSSSSFSRWGLAGRVGRWAGLREAPGPYRMCHLHPWAPHLPPPPFLFPCQQLLAKKESHGQPDYAAELPEHCVRETAGERTMVAAALSAVALQAATAYVALSLSFRLPTSKASVL